MTARIICGKPPAAPGGIAHLAHGAKRLARGLGYPAWTELSRVEESTSRYLRVQVPGRGWPLKIRIADHGLARGTALDFELISLDGRTGAGHLSDFLHAVARGEVGL